MANLAYVIVAGGDASAAVARLEQLGAFGYAGLAVSNGLDVRQYANEMQPDLILVEGPFEDVDQYEVVRMLKKETKTQHIPVVQLNAAATPDARKDALAAGFDDAIENGASVDIVIERLKPLERLSMMHAECKRRLETASTYGVSLDGVDLADINNGNCRILLVGEATPTITAIVHQLEDGGYSVERETDPYMAGDRLEKNVYDASIIFLPQDETAEKSLYLCSHIRNNPRLFNLPVLVVTADPKLVNSVSLYRQGASATVPLEPDADRLLTALGFLVRRQRLRWQLRGPIVATLTKETGDTENGTYTEEFMRAHLKRILETGRNRRRRIAVAAFAIPNIPGIAERHGSDAAARLMRQISDTIAGLVRVEDLPSRLGDTKFAVVFPGASKEEAEKAVHRIAGVLDHSEYSLSKEIMESVNIWVQSSVASWEPDDTAAGMIERAVADLT